MHMGAHSSTTSNTHTQTHAQLFQDVYWKLWGVSIHACRCYRYVNHKSKIASKEVLAMWKDPSQRSIAASILYYNISIAQACDLHLPSTSPCAFSAANLGSKLKELVQKEGGDFKKVEISVKRYRSQEVVHDKGGAWVTKIFLMEFKKWNKSLRFN